MAQKALLQAVVEEVVVHAKDIVDAGYRLHAPEKAAPVEFDHFGMHEDEQVLHEVHHSSAQPERRGQRRDRRVSPGRLPHSARSAQPRMDRTRRRTL